MPRIKKTRFRVYCGDAEGWFRFIQRRYTLDEINDLFNKRIATFTNEVLPGLVFQNDEGKLFRPQLSLTLIPKEEFYD